MLDQRPTEQTGARNSTEPCSQLEDAKKNDRVVSCRMCNRSDRSCRPRHAAGCRPEKEKENGQRRKKLDRELDHRGTVNSVVYCIGCILYYTAPVYVYALHGARDRACKLSGTLFACYTRNPLF